VAQHRAQGPERGAHQGQDLEPPRCLSQEIGRQLSPPARRAPEPCGGLL